MAGDPDKSWQAHAEAKRQSIYNAISPKWRIKEDALPSPDLRDVTGSSYIHSLLTPKEIEITETDAVGITQATTTGTWSAVEVAEAFCHRAAIAHQLVNCLHEAFFEDAIEDAKKLDAFFAANKKPVGPLHGLPVSLKDQFHVKGVETTMGYVGWIGTFEGRKNDKRRGVVESELVRELRSLGAILYCKTSVPIALMAGETANNIIKYVPNPKNRLLSAGGSSGGEGALIALRGSPGGFGTDIGGSIRIPSNFNQLFGLKPSSGRMPYQGAANSMDGQSTVLSAIGPLATTARSVKLLFKAVLSQEPWYYDPLVTELPWRDDIEEETRARIEKSRAGHSQLSFGIIRNDGVVRPHPPVQRGLRIVEQTLKRLGHKVIEWTPPSHSLAVAISTDAYTMDGGEDLEYHLSISGEPSVPQLAIKMGGTSKTATQVAALNVKKREYQKLYMDYWNSTAELTGTGRPVDGVIGPMAPHASVIPCQYNYIGYTAFLNALDYTGVAIPVTYADKNVDVPGPGAEALSQTDREIQSQYDADIYDGAPVGVQLFGRRFQEEKMLTLAEYIGTEVKV